MLYEDAFLNGLVETDVCEEYVMPTVTVVCVQCRLVDDSPVYADDDIMPLKRMNHR
jgi:hypothetical protein